MTSLSRRLQPAGSAALRLLPALAVAGAWLAFAPTIAAHGDGLPEPTIGAILTAWSFDPTLQLPILLAAALYVAAFRRVNAAHPGNPVPRRRLAFWLVGLVALEIALQSPIDGYEGVLFSVHMVQHMVLIFGAAPFLVAAAPITLILRVSSGDQRKRFVLPVLHSRVVRAISHPVVDWLIFTAVMWGTHFSPVFEWSLENGLVHDLEHLLFIGTAMLFWWPVIGVDPTPWRMPFVARVVYVFLQMPQNSFLGLAIYSARTVLYPHYLETGRTWGSAPIADQQLAGGIMWVAGDLLFLLAVIAVTAAWASFEEKQALIDDKRLDRNLALAQRREARDL